MRPDPPEVWFNMYLVQFFPSYIVPSRPNIVAISEISASNYQVTWTVPTSVVNIAGYVVSFERLSGRGCDGPHTDTAGVSSTATSYTLVGLSGFSTYAIRVAADSAFGTSLSSQTFIDTPHSCKSLANIVMYIYTPILLM